MYGDEARVMTERDKAKIQAAEMQFMSSTLGCTILDRKKNVDIRTAVSYTHLDVYKRQRLPSLVSCTRGLSVASFLLCIRVCSLFTISWICPFPSPSWRTTFLDNDHQASCFRSDVELKRSNW